MVKSISFSQEEILAWILELHAPKIECDITYGNGGFYKNIEKPLYAFDIDPQLPFVIPASSTALPLPDSSVNSVMFDPPFLTYIKKGREHGVTKKGIMSARFGGYWSYQELVDHYKGSIQEANRILKDDGVLIVKCQDTIHNHALHPTHVLVYELATSLNLELVDNFILCANHRMPVNTKGKQEHARVYHSYFMVFKKSNKKKGFRKYYA